MKCRGKCLSLCVVLSLSDEEDFQILHKHHHVPTYEKKIANMQIDVSYVS